MNTADTNASRPLPTYLVERYRAWRVNRFEPDQAWFARLAEDGQRPRAMVIACCDSRVDVNGIFGSEPGELFLVRNVANLVPPYVPDHMHHGTSAAIEYGVDFLRVAHIVVLGHAHCGGVGACHDFCANAASDALTSSTFLRSWTEILKPAYDRAVEHLERDSDLSESEPARRARLQETLEKEGIRASLNNLMSFPFVKAAVESGRLSLHGAWLDIGDGRLLAMSSPDGAFEEV